MPVLAFQQALWAGEKCPARHGRYRCGGAGRIDRIRELKNGRQKVETNWIITSLTAAQADPARLLELVRQYWSTENGTHYPLDVSTGEDRCRVRHPLAATVLGVLRRAVQGEACVWTRQQPRARDRTCPTFFAKMSRRLVNDALAHMPCLTLERPCNALQRQNHMQLDRDFQNAHSQFSIGYKRLMHKQQKQLDILIIHGESLDLVEDLKAFLLSLGLKADYAIALPAGQKPQFAKVRSSIKSTKVALVLATFDESNPSSGQARPNVYDELSECHRVLKKNVIVLVERRDNKSVSLPSNLRGHLIELHFESPKFHRLYPLLVKELRERGMIFSSRSADAPAKILQARTLNGFLDKMDPLWDNEFDEAWKLVVRGDYDTENDFSNRLDQFFNLYWDVLNSIVRKKLPPEEIENLIRAKFNDALKLTAEVWEVVAKATLARADHLKKREDEKARSRVPLYKRHYDAADGEKRAAQKSKSPYEQIAGFKRAIEKARQFIDGIDGGT